MADLEMDEAWAHAACLSIAEGRTGWDTAPEVSEAIKAVKRLRVERDQLMRCLRGLVSIENKNWASYIRTEFAEARAVLARIKV